MAGTQRAVIQSKLVAARKQADDLVSNPLSGAFLICQRRRQLRSGFAARLAPWIFSFGVALVSCVTVLLSGSLDEHVQEADLVRLLLLAGFVVGAALNYLQALYNMVSGALAFTGTTDRQRISFQPQLDDQIAVSPLSDRQMLATALRLLLPPMLLPALLACCAFLTVYSLLFPSFSRFGLGEILLLLAASLISSALALPLCSLFFIAAGGKQTMLAYSISARVFVLMQCLWLPALLALCNTFGYAFLKPVSLQGVLRISDIVDHGQIWLMLAAAGMAAFLMGLYVLYSRRSRGLLAACLGPFVPGLLLGGLLVVLQAWLNVFMPGPAEDIARTTLWGLALAQGSVLPLNPLFADPPHEYFRWDLLSTFDLMRRSEPSFFMRSIVMFCLQLALLPVFWFAALRNIRRMRRAQD